MWAVLFGVWFANTRTLQAQDRTWKFTLPLQKSAQVVVYQLAQPERLVFEMPAASVLSEAAWPTSWPSWIIRVQRQSYRFGQQKMKRWIFSFRDAFRYQIQQQEAWTLRIFPPSMRALPWLIRYQAKRGDLLIATTPDGPSRHLAKLPSHRETRTEELHTAQLRKERIQREQQQAQREKERIQREQQQAQRERERIQREQQQAQREKERIQHEQQQAQREKERIQRKHRSLVFSRISSVAIFGSLRSVTKAEQGLGFAQTKREIDALALRVERLSDQSVLTRVESLPHPLGLWEDDAALHPSQIAKRRLQHWLQRRLRHSSFEKQRLYAAFIRMQGRLLAKEVEKMFVPIVVSSQALWLKQRHLEQPTDWASWWEASKAHSAISLAASVWEPIWKPPVSKKLSVVPPARGDGRATKVPEPSTPLPLSFVPTAGRELQPTRKNPPPKRLSPKNLPRKIPPPKRTPLPKRLPRKSPPSKRLPRKRLPFVKAASPRRAAILGRSSIPKHRPRWKSAPTLLDVLERLVPLKRTAPKNRL